MYICFIGLDIQTEAPEEVQNSCMGIKLKAQNVVATNITATYYRAKDNRYITTTITIYSYEDVKVLNKIGTHELRSAVGGNPVIINAMVCLLCMFTHILLYRHFMYAIYIYMHNYVYVYVYLCLHVCEFCMYIY